MMAADDERRYLLLASLQDYRPAWLQSDISAGLAIAAAGLPSAIALAQFPAAGEVVIFDRSWYNRTGVERVIGFTFEDQVKRFLQVVPHLEGSRAASFS